MKEKERIELVSNLVLVFFNLQILFHSLQQL